MRLAQTARLRANSWMSLRYDTGGRIVRVHPGTQIVVETLACVTARLSAPTRGREVGRGDERDDKQNDCACHGHASVRLVDLFGNQPVKGRERPGLRCRSRPSQGARSSMHGLLAAIRLEHGLAHGYSSFITEMDLCLIIT